MFLSLKLVSVVILAVPGALAAANDTVNPDASTLAVGGFAQSCSRWGTPDNPVLLTASCRNRNGQSIESTLDLDRCIANYGGNLACANNGGFLGSCQIVNNVKSPNTYLQATCSNGRGGYSRASIDVNSCVGNYDGLLVC